MRRRKVGAPARAEPRPLESGPRTFLRRPGPGDEAEFIDLARASRRLHGSFARPPDTPAAFRAWLARADLPSVQIHLLCLHDGGAIAGVLNLTEIVRGPLQTANLGYYAFSPHAGRGFMREGVELVLARAFLGLGLHRVEANVQPSNTASLRLVLASGFRCEGYSPRLVYIAGRWRDHVRFALDLETWRKRVTRKLTRRPPRSAKKK
ncbi:MAG TPA: GNAT family protein [Kofleriaceae bacterium]|nr:GNAT family protein [Kofleriaceae bacterium]